MRKRVWRSALGLSVGDVVQVHHGATVCGPYEIWAIRGPYYVEGPAAGPLVIRTWPVINLVCVRPGNRAPREGMGEDGFWYVNDVRQEGDRWFTDQNVDVVLSERCGIVQYGLFDALPPEPSFQAGVDYAAGVGRVWRCVRCGLDFNAEPPWPEPAWHCGWPAAKLIVMPPRARPPEPDWSSYQVRLGFGEAQKWWRQSA